MLGRLRTMLVILALGLSAVSCSGTLRLGMGNTPTPAATSRAEAQATLQAAVEARLTAAAVQSTPTPSVDVEATVQAAVEATVAAQQGAAVQEPTAVLPAPSEFPGLLYSTYLGGGGFDDVRDLAVDGEGNVYIVGRTSSPDLPTTPDAYDGSYNGDTDAFIAKLSSDGGTLLYSTYLGGTGDDCIEAIAVDGEGSVYVAGSTYSPDFPTAPGALDTSLNGGRDAFVAKLSPAGDDLVYSTYLGGDSWEYGLNITVDGTGNAYVAGFTHGGFPTTPGAFQTTFGGAWDGYVAKLNTDGSALLYSTYLGGMGGDFVSGIVVDQTGKVYVTGGAASIDFPTTPDAWDRACDNCQTDVSEDGFVAKLNTSGSDLIYSTLIGGSATPAYPERFDSIAIDDAGNAYVAGRTTANDFPTTTGAFQTGFGSGSRDAILVKLNPDGSALLYSTYLGGSGTDDAYNIVIDSIGNAYVTGRTTSTDLPTVNPLRATNGGAYDAFVAKVNTDGGTLLYSTYFGGSADENTYGGEPHGLFGSIALDDTGGIYFIGTTRSQDFPTTAGAYAVSYSGGACDGFVALLNPLNGAGVEPTVAPEPTAAPSAEPTAASPPAAGDLLGQVTAAGRLIVSTDPNYAPQSFINDRGELDGFDVEVAKEVAGRLGVELEFVTPDWDLITGGSWGARWDVSIGSMRPTASRTQVLWFTEPYYYTPASFAVHKNNNTITNPGDLAGKKVGLGIATTYEAYLGSSLSMIGGEVMYGPPAGVQAVLYTTDAEAIQDLALGDGVRLDAVLSAQQTIQSASASGVPLKFIGTPAFYEPLVFALDKARGPSDQMLAKLNEIIAEMHGDGTLSALSTDWYGIDLTTVVGPGE